MSDKSTTELKAAKAAALVANENVYRKALAYRADHTLEALAAELDIGGGRRGADQWLRTRAARYKDDDTS